MKTYIKIRESITNDDYVYMRIKDHSILISKSDVKQIRKALKKYQPKEDKTFVVGDKVVSAYYGEGIVTSTDACRVYPVTVLFKEDTCQSFTSNGWCYKDHSEAYRNIKKAKS